MPCLWHLWESYTKDLKDTSFTVDVKPTYFLNRTLLRLIRSRINITNSKVKSNTELYLFVEVTKYTLLTVKAMGDVNKAIGERPMCSERQGKVLQIRQNQEWP